MHCWFSDCLAAFDSVGVRSVFEKVNVEFNRNVVSCGNFVLPRTQMQILSFLSPSHFLTQQIPKGHDISTLDLPYINRCIQLVTQVHDQIIFFHAHVSCQHIHQSSGHASATDPIGTGVFLRVALVPLTDAPSCRHQTNMVPFGSRNSLHPISLAVIQVTLQALFELITSIQDCLHTCPC